MQINVDGNVKFTSPLGWNSISFPFFPFLCNSPCHVNTPYFSNHQKSFLFYPLLFIPWEWFCLDTQENDVLVLLTCTHFACWNILFSIILGILNWTSCLNHRLAIIFFLRNNWKLSSSVTRIWRRGESPVEISLAGNEVNKWLPHPAMLLRLNPFLLQQFSWIGWKGCRKPRLSWKVIWEPPQVQILPTFPVSHVSLWFFSYQMPSHIAFLPSWIITGKLQSFWSYDLSLQDTLPCIHGSDFKNGED